MQENIVPVSIDLLNEGEFLKEVQEQFERAKDALLAHKVTYGERCRKAASTVDVSIHLEYDEKTGYHVVTQTKCKFPAPLPKVSFVKLRHDEDGQLGLFVEPNRVYDENPNQTLLCGRDGTGIDPQTGEASEAHTLRLTGSD
jgi:hypothetical protein